MLSLFIIGAIVTVYIFYKKSKKDVEQPHKEYPKHIENQPDDEK